MDPPTQVVLPSIVHDRQRKANQAGLLVTAELEKATARCKTKVARLAAECRKGNRQFRDIEFDLIEDRERCLHAMDTSKKKYTPADIRRISDIFEDPQFFVGGATASDISQGAVDDCWFLSALAIVSTRELVEKICVARDEKVGIYSFLFWRDSGWVDVIIDDLLYTSVPRWEALSTREQMLYHGDQSLYDKTARKGSKNIYFAKSRTKNETWVPLIEKAYAKLHGDYASLHDGLSSEGVEDLTGGVSTSMYIQDILDTNLFWNDELVRVGVDRLFGCFVPSLSKVIEADSSAPAKAPSTTGLVSGHAYSIIKVAEVQGRKFLRIRNSWGNSWKGRWSDGSAEWAVPWANELLQALDHQFGSGDGQFVMEYSDFLTTFGVIERTRLFDEDWILSSQWLSVSGGDDMTPWNYGDVSFTIKVEKPTAAVIVLAQLDGRYFDEFMGHNRWSLDFSLYSKSSTDPLGCSVHRGFWDRSVKLEAELPEAGEYVAHVRLDRRLHRAKDWLSTTASNWSGRKYARKYTEYVLSQMICANFDSSALGVELMLPAETYTTKNVTELELKALQEITEFKAKKKAAFPKPSVPSDPEAGTGGRQHEGWFCNGCGGPMPGTRWACMDVSCFEWDFCSTCVKSGVHNPNHVFMPVHYDVDDATVRGDWKIDSDDGNKVILGLRVYTTKDAPAVVSGQLRWRHYLSLISSHNH
ncbi:hypothetical protein FRB93_004627 [Tulasnella sp. JGI-2019a]|nr:hypothetical protein FRB93_004627 [Tulasnella sp. JGI-2019a]